MNQRILANVGIAALMAFLVGCDEIKFAGNLNINEALTFKQEGEDPYTCSQKPDWWNCKPGGTVVVNPGQFQTKVTLGMNGQQKQIKLEVNNANPPTVLELNFDKNINVADQFTLKADQIKQNFDVNGNIVTTVERSEEQSGMESCTYQVPQTVCRSAVKSLDAGVYERILTAELSKFGPQPGPGFMPPPVPNPGPGYYPGQHPGPYPGQFPGQHPGPYPGQFPGQHPGQYNGPTPGPVCHTVWVNRPGSMFVRYYYETTLRDIAAAFVQGDKSLGEYKGHASDTRTVYTYRGACR